MVSFVLGFIVGVAGYLVYEYLTSQPEKVAEVKEEAAKVVAEVKKEV